MQVISLLLELQIWVLKKSRSKSFPSFLLIYIILVIIAAFSTIATFLKCTGYLQRELHEMFGDLGTPDDTWLGHRPTMPDSLLVVVHSKKSKCIIYAFAYQHIGLLLGGVTGKIVTDLLKDENHRALLLVFHQHDLPE